MKVNKMIGLASGFLLLIMLTVVVEAQQTMLFDHAPSAEQMGKHLFGVQSINPGKSKTRGLSFSSNEVNKVSATYKTPAKKNSIGFLIEFAHDSSEIYPTSKVFLDEFGKMLTMQNFSDKDIIIEGHADATGPAGYNLGLSKRRAETIREFLVQNYGISSSRLVAIGQGERQPLPGKDPFDKLNRRVQFYNAN